MKGSVWIGVRMGSNWEQLLIHRQQEYRDLSHDGNKMKLPRTEENLDIDFSLVEFPDKDTLSQHHNFNLMRPWAEDPTELYKIPMKIVLHFRLILCNLLLSNIKQIQEKRSGLFSLTCDLRASDICWSLSQILLSQSRVPFNSVK